jgi:hypothetical protein
MTQFVDRTADAPDQEQAATIVLRLTPHLSMKGISV